MPIRISHIKDHSIAVYQARYAPSIVVKYLGTTTANTSKKLYETTTSSDII